jgi:hypothetical protein
MQNLSLPTSQVQLISPAASSLGTKPFSCHKCNRTFNSKYNVIRHLKQYHADKRMFKCNVCGRDYKWVDSLHKHMKLHKQQAQVCEQAKAVENADTTNTTLDSGVLVLDETLNEEIDLEEGAEAELELEPEAELNADLDPLIDDDSLIILSPKNSNFETFL